MSANLRRRSSRHGTAAMEALPTMTVGWDPGEPDADAGWWAVVSWVVEGGSGRLEGGPAPDAGTAIDWCLTAVLAMGLVPPIVPFQVHYAGEDAAGRDQVAAAAQARRLRFAAKGDGD